MAKVLKKLGYKMPHQKTQEALTVEEMFQGNISPLRSLCKKYDAFQDMPFSQETTYVTVDALFPQSKFILTVRDPDAWFESLVRFSLKGVLKRAGIQHIEEFCEDTVKDSSAYIHQNYLYNVFKRQATSVTNHKINYDWSLVYNKKHRINIFEKRNKAIIEHFQYRQDQLLVIDITKETDNSKIVEFLDLPKSYIEKLPHLNQSR